MANALKLDTIILEQVQGRGGHGATQTFSFGFTCGEINVTLKALGRPMQLVKPAIWQKQLFEGTSPDLKPKARALIAYERLFPHKPVPVGPKSGKPNDNIVDALLVCTYGVLKFGSGGLRSWSLTKINPANLAS